MKTNQKLLISVVLVTIVFATTACGTSSTNNSGTSAGPINASPSTEIPINTKPYTVGDVVALKGQNIILDSISYSDGILMASFSVENTGSSDVNLSSTGNFSAKSTNGTPLELNYDKCGSMDMSVFPGNKYRGDICYTIPSPGLFRIYYQSDLTSPPVVWEFDTNKLPATTE